MLRKSNLKNIHNIKKAGATFVTVILLFCVIIPTINSGKVTIYLNYLEELIEEKTLFPIKLKTLSSDNWWDDSWPYRKLITIDHNQINSDQINFPFLVYRSSDMDLADHAQDDGDDIVFILHSDNTTKLNHEIEHFNGNNGELFAWINIPSLSSSEDTKFWIYYGNENSENQENIEDTWNSNFVMVQHLNEQSGTLFDSTSNNNDGTNDNATFTSSAKINGAYDFDGIDNNIDVGTFDVMGSGLTLSIWFKADSFAENVICTSGLRLISKATGPETSDHFWTIAPADYGDRYRFRLKTTDFTSSNLIVETGGLSTGTWYNVVATYDGSYMRVYNDGVELGYKTTTGTVSTDDTVSVWIGSNPPNDYRAFDGVIDEVRVSNIARDESWIDLSYENQNNPGSFVSISEQELCEYTLTINIEGNGAVTKDPDQDTYEYGTEVELTAIPDTGWSFSHWSGDLLGNNNPETITMDEDKTVTAHFIINEYTLTVNIDGNGAVTKDPDQDTYEYGTEVELTAIPDTGWSFSHWSGDLSGGNNPEYITIDEDKTVIANFSENQYTLTIIIEGQGSVLKDPDQNTYEYGTEVELTAVPDTGWSFSHWSGDLSGDSNPEYITMDEDKTVIANFSINYYTLTIDIDGQGEVIKNPDLETYEYGTIVEVTAVPDEEWSFSHWSGDLSGSNNPEYITIDEDKSITAHFSEYQYTLTINIIGNGTVIKDPDQATYPSGTMVQLTAVPDNGWSFDYWSGDISGNESPTEILIDGDKTVNAHFKAGDEPPKVKIIKPDYGLYFQDKKILSFIFPIIFNEVTIEAEASDDTSVEKVEFYINGELKGTDNTPPYTYHWKDTLKRFYTVEVIAYDNEDNTDKDVLTVFLFGVKYPLLWIGLIILLSLLSFDIN